MIDTKAIKKTLTSIPDYWVVRDLSERDYGIDLMMEIFSENGVDEDNNPQYDSTGQVCYLQVKGTYQKIELNKDDNTISFSVKKKLLLYVEKFPIPFMLVRAFVNTDDNDVYFLWLQRYIMEVIDLTHPGWRTGVQNDFTVRIPASNKIDTKYSKIEKMSIRIKYIEEYSEFHSRFAHIILALRTLISGGKVDYSYFITELKRIKNLKTLMRNNNCCINEENIDTLINVFIDYRADMGDLTSIEEIEDWYNLDLLYHENDMRNITEILIAENEGESTY